MFYCVKVWGMHDILYPVKVCSLGGGGVTKKHLRFEGGIFKIFFQTAKSFWHALTSTNHWRGLVLAL